MILWRVSVRRVLFLVSLLFLVMPLGGIYFLRIYESALIRQTESELISQAAFVSALYSSEIQQALKNQEVHHYGISAPGTKTDQPFTPITPRLDLARDPVYLPRPFPEKTALQLDIFSQTAAKALIPVLQNAQRITLSGIKVLDYRGIVVAGKEEQGLSFAHTQEFQQAMTGKPVSLLRERRMPEEQAPLNSVSRNATVNVFVALPIFLDERIIGVAWLNRTPPDLWQALYSKRVELGWTALLLVGMALLISALTSFTITRPLRALIHKTRLIGKGDPEGLTPLRYPITVEVQELSAQVAQMAQAIQYRTDYIQNFAAHVSHEFKTPLTAIQGSVELLQDHLQDMPADQQMKFLGNIAEDTERLKQLVNRLLELTHADMSVEQTQSVDLVPLLREFQQYNQIDACPIRLDSGHSTETLKTRVTPESLHAVLNHLIENSRQAGAGEITLSVGQQKSFITLDIQDNGPGISPANQKEIFTPFFTTKRESGGTGLGLSIAKALIERQGGKLELMPAETGTCFRLILHLA